MERTILHCDCNGFYASVECAQKPELRHVPMAVSGSADNRHGIILAKNELAKRRGVVTAETIWQARKKCPELVLTPPQHALYAQYSKAINQIYERYTDQVEAFGIDESWLDVTGSLRLLGDGQRIADELRHVVQKETDLTISVGVSFNKVFAKLGSDYKKPNATTLITRENYPQLLFPLPVRDMLYVGRKAAETLNQMGIKTIGDLALADRQWLTETFGKQGALFSDYANGKEDSPVRSAYERQQMKSVGNGMTYRRDLRGYHDIKLAVMALSDSVAVRMRSYGVKCGTVQVMIKDPSFKTISRQKPLRRPTDIAKDLTDTAMEILHSAWDLKKPIRMLTVTGLHLTADQEYEEQLELFHEQDDTIRQKQRQLEATMDMIRGRYGKKSVTLGRIIQNDLGILGIEDIEHGSEEN